MLKSIINNSTHTHNTHTCRSRASVECAMPNAAFYCATRVVKNKYARCKKCRKNTVNQGNERATHTHTHTPTHSHTSTTKAASRTTVKTGNNNNKAKWRVRHGVYVMYFFVCFV